MMRKRFAFLGVLALVFALFPSVAFALDIWPNGSYWAGVPYNEPGYYAAFVRADNRYDAAVYGLGLDPASLSAETKLKLSDPGYGGNFYKYAMTFENVSGWDDMPEWLPTYVMMGTIGLGQSFERIYASKVTSALKTSALADYETVVNGEDSGGGGSVEVPEGQQVIEMRSGNFRDSSGSSSNNTLRIYAYEASYNDGVLSTTGNRKYISAWHNRYYISGSRMYVAHEVLESAYSYVNSGYDVVFISSFTEYDGNQYNGTESGFVYGHDITITDSNVYGGYGTHVYGNDLHLVYYDASPFYYDSSGVFCFSYGNARNDHAVTSPVGFPFFSVSIVYGVENPPPAGEWPEPTAPVTPDPPEVPTPTAPTETVDPDPTAPTITWPTSPTLVLPTSPIVSTTPEGIDYTALLTLINDNLNSIDAYLQNFYTSFNSFRSDFLSGIDDIVDGLRNIYQYLGHLNNILEVHCKHITDQIEESVYNLELYLKRLFEWLPRQLDFDAEYDDSAVTALLRRILNKIPGGSTGTPITYKPNPQSDEPSFWDWLADLFNRILQKLLDLLPDEMIQLGQLFGELINLFPFSIPWDLFALLALFGHEPVTPVIDIPWGYGGSSGQVMMIRIDLHAWDGVAEMVRPVFLVLFCLQLALLSRDLLKIINVKSGGE